MQYFFRNRLLFTGQDGILYFHFSLTFSWDTTTNYTDRYGLWYETVRKGLKAQVFGLFFKELSYRNEHYRSSNTILALTKLHMCMYKRNIRRFYS